MGMLPPKKSDWVEGTYQIGVFIRTPEGETIEAVSKAGKGANPGAVKAAARIVASFLGTMPREVKLKGRFLAALQMAVDAPSNVRGMALVRHIAARIEAIDAEARENRRKSLQELDAACTSRLESAEAAHAKRLDEESRRAFVRGVMQALARLDAMDGDTSEVLKGFGIDRDSCYRAELSASMLNVFEMAMRGELTFKRGEITKRLVRILVDVLMNPAIPEPHAKSMLSKYAVNEGDARSAGLGPAEIAFVKAMTR